MTDSHSDEPWVPQDEANKRRLWRRRQPKVSPPWWNVNQQLIRYSHYQEQLLVTRGARGERNLMVLGVIRLVSALTVLTILVGTWHDSADWWHTVLMTVIVPVTLVRWSAGPYSRARAYQDGYWRGQFGAGEHSDSPQPGPPSPMS